MRPDHYQVLGVAAQADQHEIRAAYRRLMRQHHPDVRPGDPGAEEMARRVTQAWAVLGRPAARARYDRASAAAPTGPAVPPRPVPVTKPAYSAAQHQYRRAFHAASLRVGGVVFAVGLLLLLTFGR